MKNKYIMLALLPLLSAGSIFATEAAVKQALITAITATGGNPDLYVISTPTAAGLLNIRIDIDQSDYVQVLPHVIIDLENYAKNNYNEAETQLKNIRDALQKHRAAQYTGIWKNLLGYCGKAPKLVSRTIDPQIEDINTALRNIYWTKIVTEIANKRDDVLFIGYQASKVAAIATVAVLTYRNRVALYSWMPKSLPALPTFFKAAAKNPSVTINVAFAPAASAISSAAGKIAEAAAPAAAQVAQALVSK